jgi:hypothetical protein
MRNYYLHKRGKASDGCRGGVHLDAASHAHLDNFELEIGGNCLVTPEAMTMVIFMDEITSHLACTRTTDPIADMLLRNITAEAVKIRENLIEEDQSK